MSPLYGAAFLWLIAAILWWSGWREETTRNMPPWAVGLFLAAWPLACLGKVPIAGSVSVNGAWALTLLFVILLLWRLPAARKWTAASGGLLVGSISFLAGRLALLPSGFVSDAAAWAIAALIGLLAALLLRSASEQILAISVCLVLKEAAGAFLRAQADAPPELLPVEGLQEWWIAVLGSRLWTAFADRAGDLVRKWAIKTGGGRGGQRS